MNKIKFINDDDAVNKMIDAAIKHSISSVNGDYKDANMNFDIVQNAVHYLRYINQLDKLRALLYNENVSVRLAAASYFLVHDERIAIEILENIVKQNLPHMSFNAKMVLSEWKDGNLKL